MKDPWETLGIERTSNKVLIKSAFAKLVKENPPDKDAEKYQEIRKAYEEALKGAASIKSNVMATKVNTEQAFDKLFEDSPHEYTESEFTELDPEENQEQPQETSEKIESIRELREKLFAEKAVSLADLVKAYKIQPIQKPYDNKSSNSSSSSSGSGRSFINRVLKIFGIIWLIASIIRLLGKL